MARLEKSLGLVWTLVRTDFKGRYHGTLGGFLWALLKPLLMFLVLMGVFSFIFAGDPDYKLDLIIALMLWEFFAEGTKVGLASLHAKGYLLTRARLPTWIIVVSSASNALITLSVFVLVVSVFLALSHKPPGLMQLGLFALYQVAHLLIVLGFGLGASVLFLKYRDLNQVWDVFVQAGFFVAPIIYPLEILPERLHFYLYLWPPTPVIMFSRSVLVDGVIPTARAHLLLAALTLVILGVGIVVHRHLAPGSLEEL